MARLTAVVVEDSSVEAEVLAQMIRRLKIEVVAMCEDGVGGLAAIRRLKPTIATIDNQMTGMNGLEVVRALVAEGTTTLLVICSGTAAIGAQARAVGAYFIVKPYDNTIVKRALLAILGQGG